MLYVLECMLYLVIGMSDEPLSTTGKLMTINDIGVGFLGLLVIVAIIWLVVYCIRFFVKKRKIANSNSEHFDSNKRESRLSFWNGILYYFECYILLFLYLLHGKNLIMKTTENKPTKNEIAISIIWWIYTALIIVGIVLICI